MGEISKTPEISETTKKEAEGFKAIKSEGGMTSGEAKSFWERVFQKSDAGTDGSPEVKGSDKTDKERTEIDKSDMGELIKEYVDDLRDKSDVADTIGDKPFDAADIREVSTEENAKMREEFDDCKKDLKKQWEAENGRPWPKYDSDVLNENGVIIRQAGWDFDAHHIQPLCVGGKNEVSNITPLHAGVHYDSKDVHRTDGPCDKLCKAVREVNDDI